MSGASAAKRKRGVRVLGLGFLALFIALCVAAVIAYAVYNGRPGYWDQQRDRIEAMSQQDRRSISDNLENDVATGWSDADNDFPASEQDLYDHRSDIEIPYEDLNIWLAERGVALLGDLGIKLPSYVKSAMVDSPGDELLRISCDIQRGKRMQIVSLTFAIEVTEDGQVVSTLEGARAGRLPMPTRVAADLIAQRGDSGGIMVGLTRGEPVGPIELPIDAARSGRLVGLDIREDALVITRETVRPKPTE